MFKQNRIDKIIIIGQVLRADFYSCEWLYRLFGYYIETVTELPVYCIFPKQEKDIRNSNFIPFDVETFYKYYDIPFEYTFYNENKLTKSWTNIFYKTNYNKDAYEYIYKLFKNSLVISYEVEDCISSILEYYKIPQIDINLDPIRFLDDIILCFKSRDKKVYKQLLKYRINEDYIKLIANYIKNVYGLAKYNKNENKVLFLGQTDCDKTIIDHKNQKIYSILEHKEEFLKAIDGYDKILYKRHPFVMNDDEIIEYIKSIGNVEITEENFYKLVSDDNIKKVVSISSGTCSEAKYFGKVVQTLLKEGIQRQTENKVDTNKYVSIYQDYFSLNFWSDILAPIIKTKKYHKKITIAGLKNRLRNSRLDYPMYWGYEDFEQINIKNDINRLFNEKLNDYNEKINDCNIRMNDINNQVKEKIIKSFFLQDYLINNSEDED